MSDIENMDTNADTGAVIKESNKLLNIIMIVMGAVFVLKGVFDLLLWLEIVPFPTWIQAVYDSLKGDEASSALSFLGSQGIISTALGFWSVIAGILLFREQESGWGMSLVILSIMTVIGITSVITWITVPGSFDLLFWPNWITIFATIVGLFGFIYLLITKKRYN